MLQLGYCTVTAVYNTAFIIIHYFFEICKRVEIFFFREREKAKKKCFFALFFFAKRRDVLLLHAQEKIPKEARDPQVDGLSVAAGDGIVRTWRLVNADLITSDSLV